MSAPMPSAPPTAPIPQYPGQDFACAGAPPQPQMYPAEGIPTQAAVPGPYLPPQPGQAVYGYPVQQTMGQPIPQNMGQPVQYPMQPGQYPQYGTSGTVTYGQGGVPVYHTTTEKKKNSTDVDETCCLAFLAGCAFCCCLEAML